MNVTRGRTGQQIGVSVEPWVRGYPESGLPRLFEEQARARSKACAVAMGEVRMSYEELNRRANRVVHTLMGLGATVESCVGLMLPRSVEAIVAMLGILKSGGAYVPLPPGYPAERLNLIASDCGMRWVVTDRRYAWRVPPAVTPVWVDNPDGDDDSDPGVEIEPDNLACVLYTSGSTGMPKGVQVLHRGIVRMLFGVDYAQLGPGEVVLHTAALTFDASSFEIWGALLHGGRLVIYPEGAFSPQELGAVVRAHGVTTVLLTTPVFNLVIDEAPEAFSTVRQLLVGGETLSVAHVRRGLEHLPGTALVNVYGPTEGTTFTCCYRIPRELPEGMAAIPIGPPIANTQVYVLDREGNEVAPGTAGELFIGGDGVARGYVNRKELTRERFLPNRFTGRGKLYRSGDLVQMRPDGMVEFLGRLDNQVKIRGHRIEPGEVEAAIMAHPAVRAAAVIAGETGRGDRCLVAYVGVGPNGTAPTDLREFLQARLPGYMIPARIVPVERIPLQPNGKLDRAALPALVPAAAAPGRRAPADKVERKVAAIWKELLDCECPDAELDFFETGGDSLMVVRVADRMEKAFGRKFPIAALVQASTIRGMAGLVRRGSARQAEGPVVPIQTEGSKPPLFGVHDVRGQVLLFAALSAHFGPDQPVYGLQPWGLRPGRHVFATIEEMAEQYLREVRAIQPAGPYRLAGACFGGVVAFEMARQLEAAGERVDLLALLDAFAPGSEEVLPRLRGVGPKLQYLTRRYFWLHARALARMGPADLRDYVVAHARTLKRRVLKQFWVLGSVLRSWFSGARVLEPETFEHAGYCAHKSYVPKPYGGSAVLFRARERSALDTDLKAGWGEFIHGEIEVCEIPGDHLSMLSHPNRSVVAREMARRLAGAGQRAAALA